MGKLADYFLHITSLPNVSDDNIDRAVVVAVSDHAVGSKLNIVLRVLTFHWKWRPAEILFVVA